MTKAPWWKAFVVVDSPLWWTSMVLGGIAGFATCEWLWGS